jgi:transcriptional regulator with XRE-family HTH domain
MARKPHNQPMHDELLLVRHERIKRGLSIGDVADAVGTSRQHMQRLETGERNISLDWLIKLAAFFEIPVGQLIRDGDGLSPEERDLVLHLRKNPVHRKIMLSQLGVLKETMPSAPPE